MHVRRFSAMCTDRGKIQTGFGNEDLKVLGTLIYRKLQFMAPGYSACPRKTDFLVSAVISTLIPPRLIESRILVKLKRISIFKQLNKEILLLLLEEMFWHNHRIANSISILASKLRRRKTCQ